jgi:hypothetical protein
MLEHGAEIAAIDPASASGALDEMFGLIGRWSAGGLASIFVAPDIGHSITSSSNAAPSGSCSLKPCLGGGLVRKHPEVLAVANSFARVDVDPNCCHPFRLNR